MRYAFCGGMLGGPWMMGIGLLVIILVVYLIYRSSNNSSQSRHYDNHSPQYDEALDILKMKFVNGEITEEEYLRKRNLLMK